MTISTRLHQPWLVLMTLFTLFIGLSACGPGSGESPDDAPPTLEITDGPEEVTTDSSASFSLSCNRDEGCDFECALDGRQFQSCQSPVTYDSLDDGQHFFEARATDADGRRSDVAIWEWTIDSAPPEIEDLTGPPEATNASDAEFEFSCTKENCEFFCAIDGQTPSQCESPTTYDELADGDHIFSVYAVDDLGTEGPPTQWE